MTRLNREPKYICEICGKACTTPSALAGHKRFVHGEKNAKVESQKECDHNWKQLTAEELSYTKDGKTIKEYGYKYKCIKCGELR